MAKRKHDNKDVFMEFPNERELFLSFPLLKFISVRVIFSTWNITRSESEILCVLFKHEFSQFLQASSIDVGGGGLGPLRFFFAANLQYKK